MANDEKGAAILDLARSGQPEPATFSRDPKIRARQLWIEKNKREKLNGAQPQQTQETEPAPEPEYKGNGAPPAAQRQADAEPLHAAHVRAWEGWKAQSAAEAKAVPEPVRPP